MKIVINKCYGGFGLSLQAQRSYANRKGITLHFYRQTKYEHCDGVAEYARIDSSENSSFTHAHQTDHGQIFNGKCEDGCYYYPEIPRDDPDLIAVVEDMGDAANGEFAKLKIVEIPDDTEFEIDEYDGMEHIAEKHQTWG